MADEYDGYITKTDAIKAVMFGANRPLIIAGIKEIPSADVQPVVHGEWVDGGVDGVGACGIEYRYKKCSICDYEYSFPIKYNFCPNCGAKMDGE